MGIEKERDIGLVCYMGRSDNDHGPGPLLQLR